jgi:transcription elongation GreA/GreB family factor
MPNPALLAAIVSALESELEAASREARAAASAATDPDSKAENKYDTRALEASYLARGQAQRVTELTDAVAAYRALAANPPAVSGTVVVGATVILDTPAGRADYFLGPAAGGTEVRHAGRDIVLITLASPLGRQLLGKSAGASITLQPGRPAWVVRSVE